MPFEQRRPSRVSALRTRPLTVALLVVLGASQAACAAAVTQRPFRFDVAGPPLATTTQDVARRMSRDADTTPVIIDTARGLVYSKWVVVGASADVRLWPPGEDRSWLVQRWRAVIVPQGPANMVLIDQERVLCDATAGFRVDPVTLFGRCRPDPSIAEEGQRRIDAKGLTLANTR